jgi:hypothetical protein
MLLRVRVPLNNGKRHKVTGVLGMSKPATDFVARQLETLDFSDLPSPKLNPATSAQGWYPYYAGYADSFVAKIVESLPADVGTILDPWNGSGTTTSVATAQGLKSRGLDLNPAAVVIAKARLLGADVVDSLVPLAAEIVSRAERDREPNESEADSLSLWFQPRAARFIRAIERRIYRVLVDSSGAGRAIDRDGLIGLSPLAAFFYLALFRTVRPSLRVYRGSNPTWIRSRIPWRNRLNPTSARLADRFQNQVSCLATSVSVSGFGKHSSQLSTLGCESSTSLSIADTSIDAVITSPPYCTRIDYVIATLPELAVMGIKLSEIKPLRDRMIGTPTIQQEREESDEEKLIAGPISANLLRQIRAHSSKASSGYYAKFYRQYFRTMRASLAEISRVTRDAAPLVMVAQDSFYKDIHVDLPTVLDELATEQGWSRVGFQHYSVRNFASINRRSRNYRDATSATEAVLLFSK